MFEAQARGAKATIAVVDRVGNVLARVPDERRGADVHDHVGHRRHRRPRGHQRPAVGAGGHRQGRHRRVPVVGGQCVLDADGEPDHPAEFQSRREQPALGPAVRRAVQPAVVLGSQSARHGRHHRPEAFAAGARRRSRRPAAVQERHARRRRGRDRRRASIRSTLDIHDQRHRRRRADRRRRRRARSRRPPIAARTRSPSTAARCATSTPRRWRAIPRRRRRSPSINGVVGTLVNVPGYGGSPMVAGTAFGTPASGFRADTSAGIRRPRCVRAGRRGQRQPLSAAAQRRRPAAGRRRDADSRRARSTSPIARGRRSAGRWDRRRR